MHKHGLVSTYTLRKTVSSCQIQLIKLQWSTIIIKSSTTWILLVHKKRNKIKHKAKKQQHKKEYRNKKRGGKEGKRKGFMEPLFLKQWILEHVPRVTMPWRHFCHEFLEPKTSKKHYIFKEKRKERIKKRKEEKGKKEEIDALSMWSIDHLYTTKCYISLLACIKSK